MKKTSLMITYLINMLFLTGCVQMGPLYLPDQKPPVYVPKPSPRTVH